MTEFHQRPFNQRWAAMGDAAALRRIRMAFFGVIALIAATFTARP